MCNSCPQLCQSPCGFGQHELDLEIATVFKFSETEAPPKRVLGVSLIRKSFWPQATEDAGQEAPQAAGHLGRLKMRLPRDDTDVSWTSPLFSRSGSQCPAGLQSRNT